MLCMICMWRTFCAVLVVLSRKVGGRKSYDVAARDVSYVLSVRGGATGCGKSTSVEAERMTQRTAAWSLPWRAIRRKGRRKAAVRCGKGRLAPPSADAAARKMSPATSTHLFNISLTSLVSAMLLGGGTITLSPQVVGASPFDPRPPPKSARKPYFVGWFIRLTDHEQRLSFAVIIGSFRGRGGKELDQHYVSLSYLHEPKGGIPPADAQEDRQEEATESTANDGVEKGVGEVGGGEVGGNSPQARSSEIATRFSRWIREQRLAVLRGFDADEGNEEGVKENAASSNSEELGDGHVSIGTANERPSSESSGDEGEAPVAAIGKEDKRSIGDEGYTGARGSLTPTLEDTDDVTKEEQVGRREDGPTPRDVEGAKDCGKEIDNDRREGDEGLEGRGGELVDTVIEPQEREFPPSPSVAVGARGCEGKGAAFDASNIRSAAGQDPPESENAGGARARSGVKGTSKGFVVQPSASVSQHPLSQPPESGGTFTQSVSPEEDSTERTHTFHAFPPADTVTISCRGEPVDSVPKLRDDPNFTWEADGIGSFTINGDAGRLSFQLPELSLAACFRHREPWSRERPNSAGPEGWLQKTGLLPLHYFVHSMGSEAGYSLKATDAPRAVVGRGRIHMEANYGETFPTGWVWAQGCSATEGLCGNIFRDGDLTGAGAAPSQEMPGRASKGTTADSLPASSDSVPGGTAEMPAYFVLTGGRFVIGPVTTTSFVLAFRSNQHNWNFRTTDLDRFVVKVSRKESRLTIVAKSWGGNRVLEADFQAPKGSFGTAIYVPTAEGFSNTPGCVESYAAKARFRLYTKGDKVEGDGVTRPLVLREEVEFKLAALEFGGEYQDT